jgi:cysteine desulfurase / selenocysteine lyase
MEYNACRCDFPALSREIDGRPIAYLDNAATTLKPRSVIDAITRYYEENGCSVHRGNYFLSQEATDAFEGVRTRVARFIGASGNEIVFVKNTTEALNLVASGLGLGPDDLVIGSLDAHHSQMLPWRRHARLELVRVDRTGRIDMDHYHELLRLRPKVVALTHCSNVTGAIAPIEEMARAAKAVCGATVVVDAAQSIPHRRLDVSELPIDFLAFSGHKMLAPTGIGCLYGRREALEGLRPMMVGGGMVDWVDLDDCRERKIPHRLEAGTPPIASVLGLGAAVAYLESYGEERHHAHERALTGAMLRHVLGCDYLDLIGPREAEDRCSIVSLRVHDCDDLADIARSLSDSFGLLCRSGHLCAQPLVDAHATGDVLRVSAYIYNTTAEIDLLFEALEEVVGYFV